VGESCVACNSVKEWLRWFMALVECEGIVNAIDYHGCLAC
jgi:hypothetical protein